MDIGKHLRELREANGLSHSDVEDRPGLLCAYVSHIENGHSAPTFQVLEKRAAALDVDVYELFADVQGEPESGVLSEGIQFGAQERAFLNVANPTPTACHCEIAKTFFRRKVVHRGHVTPDLLDSSPAPGQIPGGGMSTKGRAAPANTSLHREPTHFLSTFFFRSGRGIDFIGIS